MAEKSKGLYRQPAGDDEPVAYVVSDGTATFVTESEYREYAIEPPFETLPTQGEYEEAVEKEDMEASEEEEIAKGRAEKKSDAPPNRNDALSVLQRSGQQL
jgi:hypothetical protein